MSFKKKATGVLLSMMKQQKGIVAGTIRECIAAVEQIPEDGWISTAEQLPDEEFVRQWKGKYAEYPQFLVVIQFGICAAVLSYWGNNTWVDDQGYHYTVNYWQPLPEIPKGR